jgi:hypothetical protein
MSHSSNYEFAFASLQTTPKMHKLSPTSQKQWSFLFCQLHQITELSQFVELPSVPQSDKAVWGFLESMVTFQAFSCLELHHACKHECTDNVYISFCHLVTAFQNLPKQTECSLEWENFPLGSVVVDNCLIQDCMIQGWCCSLVVRWELDPTGTLIGFNLNTKVLCHCDPI